MQRLKPRKIEKIKQKLVCTIPLNVSIQNNTKSEIAFECEETVDGVRPKMLIKIRRVKRKINKMIKKKGKISSKTSERNI